MGRKQIPDFKNPFLVIFWLIVATPAIVGLVVIILAWLLGPSTTGVISLVIISNAFHYAPWILAYIFLAGLLTLAPAFWDWKQNKSAGNLYPAIGVYLTLLILFMGLLFLDGA